MTAYDEERVEKFRYFRILTILLLVSLPVFVLMLDRTIRCEFAARALVGSRFVTHCAEIAHCAEHATFLFF